MNKTEISSASQFKIRDKTPLKSPFINKLQSLMALAPDEELKKLKNNFRTSFLVGC